MKEIYVRNEAEFSRFLHAVYCDMELCAEWIYETYYNHYYIFLNYGDEEGNIRKVLFYEIDGSSINTIRDKHADEWDNVDFIIGIKNVKDFENWFYSLAGDKLLFPPLDKLFTEKKCYFKFLDHKEPDDQFVEIMIKYLADDETNSSNMGKKRKKKVRVII